MLFLNKKHNLNPSIYIQITIYKIVSININIDYRYRVTLLHMNNSLRCRNCHLFMTWNTNINLQLHKSDFWYLKNSLEYNIESCIQCAYYTYYIVHNNKLKQTHGIKWINPVSPQVQHNQLHLTMKLKTKTKTTGMT